MPLYLPALNLPVRAGPRFFQKSISRFAPALFDVRKNLVTNPKAGAGDTAGWDNTGPLPTFEAVTLSAGAAPAPSAEMASVGLTTGFHVIGDDPGHWAQAGSPLPDVGGDYSFSLYLYIVTLGGATNLSPGIADYTNEEVRVPTTTTGSWLLVSGGRNFAAIEAGDLWIQIFQTGAGAPEYYFTGALIQPGISPGPYFDGSVAPATWEGAANASISDGPALFSMGLSSASLAITFPTAVPLGTSAAISSASLFLTAKTAVPLGVASAVSSATLALTAPTRVPLGASSAVSSATLALTAPTTVPLGASTATSSATLALTTPTTIALGASSAQSSATLSLTAATQVPLDASSAQSSATLVLGAGGVAVPLGAASAVSSATLALTAPALPPPAPPTFDVTVGPHLLTLYPGGTIGVYEGEPPLPSEEPPEGPLQTVAVADTVAVTGLTAGDYYLGALVDVIYQPARGNPYPKPEWRFVSFRVP